MQPRGNLASRPTGPLTGRPGRRDADRPGGLGRAGPLGGRGAGRPGWPCAGAMAATAAPRGITIDVDHCELLGLHNDQAYLHSQVTSAYDRLIREKLEDGYSAKVAAGRQQLLEDAREELLKSNGKAAVEDPAWQQSKGLNLPLNLVPGTVAHLVQLGRMDLVLKIGNKMLNTKEGASMKRDLLLSMALAKLGQADDLFSTSSEVSTACARMEEALQYLEEGGNPALAPELANEIQDALEKYVPQCVLDQLRLPLTPENAQGRKQALPILQELLAVPDQNSPNKTPEFSVDRHYVKQALELLTSVEVLEMTDWPKVLREPKCVQWYYPGVLLRAAVAHIVVGFVQKKPAPLQTIDEILSLPGKIREAHVEHVICKVLMGQVESALYILDNVEGTGKDMENRQFGGDRSFEGGYSPSESAAVGAKALPARNETLTFVRQHSPQGDTDLLPGLCLFAERWLSKAFLQFRDTSAQLPDASLVAYFKDNRSVGSLRGKKPQRAAATQGGSIGMLPSKANESIGSMPVPVANRMQTDRRLEAEQRWIAQGQGQVATIHDAQTRGADADIYAPPAETLLFDDNKRRRLPVLAILSGGVALGAAIYSLSNRGLLDIVAGASALESPSYALTEEQKTTLSGQPLDTPLESAQAEKLIKRWQYAKSLALGPRHDSRLLRTVLAEPMLGEWANQVQDVSQQGWFWKYKLDGCRVSAVDTTHFRGGVGRLGVVATLKESASMYGADGRQADRYKSTYDVEYSVILGRDGQWKISRANVLSQ
eukprot:evm.model.scf_1973.1 EVM.evm.TU.scf_1973.1   scf_1973:18423-26966(+)